jgi:GPH family glycoside/pentoside/hexuronide:cation symporter
MSTAHTKLTVREKVAFGLGDTASNFVWATMTTFLAYYYTNIFGISAAAMGALLLFARVADGFIDVVIGAIADRTNTKWGKFRPYLLWLCIPLAVIFVLTFTVPPDSWNKALFTLPEINIFGWQAIAPQSLVTGKLIYAWLTYNLMMFMYSAINIPYGALSGVLTDDPDDRNSLGAYRMAFANIGGLIVTGLTLPLTDFFGQGNLQVGYQGTVIVFSILAIFAFLFTFFNTRERILPPPDQHANFFADLKTIAGNRHLLIMFLCAVLNMTFVIARGGIGIFYYKDSLGFKGDADIFYLPFGLPAWGIVSALLVLGNLGMIVGTMLTNFASHAMGKKIAFIVTMALGGLIILPFYFIPPGHAWTVAGLILIGQIIGGINASLYWSMLGDIADFTEWKYNIRNTGIVFSATTLAQKVGMGIGGGAIVGYILEAYHYQPQAAQQSAEAIHGINLLMSVIPGAGFLLIAGIFCFYGLNDRFCAKMREDLNQRRIERGQQPV